MTKQKNQKKMRPRHWYRLASLIIGVILVIFGLVDGKENYFEHLDAEWLVVSGVILVAVAASLTVAIDLSGRIIFLLWLAVVVFTIYTATMAALGAMYSQIRAARAQPAGDQA